jgi:protein-S-isoprenylcysteine O-methyltransferase Ste14
MTLHERMLAVGKWLFRWRSYLPLSFILILVPGIMEFSYPEGSHAHDLVWEMVCLSISFFGLFIRCYTIGYVPKGTSGRNTKRQVAAALNTTGMYSITRNPLYLGNFFMMLGILLVVRLWWVVLIYALSFWIYYERIIYVEEEFLKEKFGDDYEQYEKSTPVFIPNFKLWRPPNLPFSLKNVLKREYSGFFGVIASFTVLEISCDYAATGKLILDKVWLFIFLIGLVAYSILRTLKKKTRLLHVAPKKENA